MKKKVALICGAIMCMFTSIGCEHTEKTKPIIHASTLPEGWYPKNSEKLKQLVSKQINFAEKHFNVDIHGKIKGIIAPHAGLAYSGIAAASAYKHLKVGPEHSAYSKVILLAPSHSASFHGIALPEYSHYQFALGTIPVDRKTIKQLAKNPLFKIMQNAHQNEHSIEIQLPFLKTTLPNAEIIPLIVGTITKEEISQIAEELKKITTDNTLVIATSDFTHYGKGYGYAPFTEQIAAQVKMLDSIAIENILELSPDNFSKFCTQTGATICGRGPIQILLNLATTGALGNIETSLASYYTTAHIKGRSVDQLRPKDLCRTLLDSELESSVGYAGIVFSEVTTTKKDSPRAISGYEANSLLSLARRAIELEFTKETHKHSLTSAYPVMTRNLREPRGAFVTIETKHGDLKGCIGRTTSTDPLIKTVIEMSRAAAFSDHRFSPLKQEELNDIVISISILSLPQPVNSYKDITIGKHGIILEKRMHGRTYSAVYLPDVAPGQGWNIEQTLTHLSQKAGLAADAWKSNCKFRVFEGQKIKESN